jgi:adenosylcobinamide kinase/adenosylcobinamide-phosphate guanylyltransferase
LSDQTPEQAFGQAVESSSALTGERAEHDGFDPVKGTVLLEDLSNLVVNDCAHVLPAVLASDNAVVVANEIGSDGARYDEFTLAFIDNLGALACGIAARADAVVEVVAGLPRVVKGELPWVC